MNYISKKKYFIKQSQGGMTLLELLVVLGIFALISSLTMFNYGKFNSSTSTQNLANDIALSVRKAQSSAIGVRAINSDFSYGHGIHFTNSTDNSNIVAGSNKSFVLFTDIDSSFKYTYPGSSNNTTCGSSGKECEEIISINGADKIKNIYLSSAPSTPQNGMLDIVFKRPDPDAYFCYRTNNISSCSTNFSYVKIQISNGKLTPDEITRMITIWNTGQISVK